MSIRVGVAGVAGMGLMHVVTVPRIDGYELTALCDVAPEPLERAAGLAADAALFTDFDAFCSSRVADAVVIATPNAFHADNVSRALEAGLHVYCEKPLGVTVGECRTIADLARSAGRRIQIGFQHRFQHGYASAKRIVEADEIGPLRRADLRATDWFRPNNYFSLRPWRARWQQAGGGVLMLQAIHQLDAYLWIAGMPSRVTAKAWRARPDVEVEDDVYAVLEFANGARGMLTASTLDPGGTNRIELTGDCGAIRAEGERLRTGRWDDATSTMLRERKDPFEAVPVTWENIEQTGDAMTFDECVAACHRDFVDAVDSGREPLNNASEATKSVEVANAVYLSALTGEPVDLPLDTDRYQSAFKQLCAGELSLPSVAFS
ncbi:MAG: Gfo/Idh/MocA family oxidoreductase [Actinomycetota bacterium]